MAIAAISVVIVPRLPHTPLLLLSVRNVRIDAAGRQTPGSGRHALRIGLIGAIAGISDAPALDAVGVIIRRGRRRTGHAGGAGRQHRHHCQHRLSHFLPPKVLGPAVEMSLAFGGTSGRFSVATYASRLFPKVLASFIEGVRNEHLVADSEFEPRRYARDSVTSVDTWLAEFTTPAGVSGLGTAGVLGPSKDPIHGVAVIVPGSEQDMIILLVRLGGNMGQVEAAVLRLNRECMQKAEGC